MTTISSLNEVYQPFMVDCETIGTIPNTAPVLQIAVVSFLSFLQCRDVSERRYIYFLREATVVLSVAATNAVKIRTM